MSDFPSHPGITILGLGPGNPGMLTRQVIQVLESCTELWVSTRQHPALEGLPTGLHIHTFELLDPQVPYSSIRSATIEKILELGQRSQGVVYAVPGHPATSDPILSEISRRAQQIGLPVQVLAGLSFLEPVLNAIGLAASPGMCLMDAKELVDAHVPPFPTSLPALITQLDSSQLASGVNRILRTLYPDGHLVFLVHRPGTDQELVEKTTLGQTDLSAQIGPLTTLYVPALGSATSFEALFEVVAHLRAPDGCPWDREQDYLSLRPHLLEETYELLSALDAGNKPAMREELGDLLMQVLMYAQIASEYGDFNIADILTTIHTKLVQRHPHVFGDEIVEDVDGVLKNWEKIKAAERQANGKTAASMLDGVPLALPALVQADQYVKRAARVGFDWPNISRVRAKVEEELAEVDETQDPIQLAVELGDLLFAVVNLARWHKVDPEGALREANARFRGRFNRVEALARQQNRPVSGMTVAELEELWQIAKNTG